MINLFRRLNRKNADCARLQREKAALEDHLYDARLRLQRQEEINVKLHRVLREENQKVILLAEECERLRKGRDLYMEAARDEIREMLGDM